MAHLCTGLIQSQKECHAGSCYNMDNSENLMLSHGLSQSQKATYRVIPFSMKMSRMGRFIGQKGSSAIDRGWGEQVSNLMGAELGDGRVVSL